MVKVGGQEFDENTTVVRDVEWTQLPTQIGLLTELTELSLVSEDLSGPVPTQVGLLQKLVELHLGDNALSGRLPTELGLLRELVHVTVGQNTFSGPLPSELGRLVKLQALEVGTAGLNGTIFTEIGNLEGLLELRLGFNGFHGGIPTEIGRMQQLRVLNLARNDLSGPIPSELGGLLQLDSLALDRNSLSREIPSELWRAAALRSVALEGNALEGTLDGINQSVSLKRLKLHDGNRVTGTLDALKGMAALSELNIKDNRFTGSLEVLTTLQELRRLEAARNEFNGSIPEELGLLPKLQRLWLESNALTGPIPPMLGNSSKLQHLLLGDNQLTGALPKELFANKKLVTFDASRNKLTGTIPPELFHLPAIREIRLHRNAFAELPFALTNLRRDVSILVMLDMTVTCDCRLTWLPAFVVNSTLMNPSSIGTCSDANEHTGRPLYLLQTEAQSPCAHAELSTVLPSSSTASSIEVAWTWEDLVGQLPTFESTPPADLLADHEAMASLGACDGFVFNGRGQQLLGFHVQVDEVRVEASRRVRDLCMLPEKIDTGSSVFAQVIHGLSPATQYEVRVRAFRLTLNRSIPGALRRTIEVSYFFGPFGSRLGVKTMDARPRAAVTIQPKRREADVIEVEWLPLAANDTGGTLQGYTLYEHDPDRSVALEAYQLSHRFTGLASRSQGFVNFSIAARTSAGEGPRSETHVLLACPANSRGEDNGVCEAVPGFFMDSTGAFVNCAELTKDYPALWNGCVEPGMTAATLPVAPRYWKANAETALVLPCPVGEYCEPIASVEKKPVDEFCAANRTGVFCHECERGLVIAGRGCFPCNDGARYDASVSVALTAALFILIGLGLVVKILWDGKVIRCFRKKQGGKAKVQRRKLIRPLTPSTSLISAVSSMPKAFNAMREETGIYNKLKIFIGFQQVFFSYQRTFQFQESRSTQLLSFMTSLNPKHMMNQIQYRCLVNYNFYGVLLASTLTPILFVIFIAGLTYLTVACLRHDRRTVREPFAEIFLALLFLFYPDVSETVFETFPCQSFNLSHGEVYKLQVDYRTDCEDGPARAGWLVYAGVMVLVYPVGVAALYAWIAIHHHRKGYAKFLIRPYDASCRWYETYELVRKLMQTSLIVLVRSATRDPAILGLISLNVCLVALLFLVFMKPYKFFSDFWFATMSLLMLLPATQLSVIDPYAREQQASWQITQLDAIVLTEFIFFVLFLMAEMTGFDVACAAKVPSLLNRYYGNVNRGPAWVGSPGSKGAGTPGNSSGDDDRHIGTQRKEELPVEKASLQDELRTSLVQVGSEGGSSGEGEVFSPVKRASVGTEQEGGLDVTGVNLQLSEEEPLMELDQEDERLMTPKDIERA